jgi:lysozyme
VDAQGCEGPAHHAAGAESILTADLAKVAQQVASVVTVPLNENQFGALVSFTFNLGLTNLKRSTLLKRVNASDFAGAAAEFGKWVNAAGKKMPGLVKRRAAEAALFSTPAANVVTSSEPVVIPSPPDDPGVPVDPDEPVFKPTGLQAFIAAILDFFLGFLRKGTTS